MSARASVIGHPVVQSLSPVMHGASFRELGVDWTYDAVDCTVEELGTFIAGVRSGSHAGLSVTMPLKEAIVPLLDRLDANATVLGAVNCVSVRGGTLVGHNTDGDGCADALENEAGAVLAGARAVVLGAGGTARSVVTALARRGASVRVVNRTPARADEVVSVARRALGGDVDIVTGSMSDIGRASVLVNTTSVGMNSDDSPVEPGELHGGLVVLDAVYSPIDTALLRSARAAGARTVDGLWMLVHQARHQQLLWFGRCAPAALMRSESERELDRRRK
ncbi:MAG: shikimate dehydrogenase [Ilumatobacteraceae bacterium]